MFIDDIVKATGLPKDKCYRLVKECPFKIVNRKRDYSNEFCNVLVLRINEAKKPLPKDCSYLRDLTKVGKCSAAKMYSVVEKYNIQPAGFHIKQDSLGRNVQFEYYSNKEFLKYLELYNKGYTRHRAKPSIEATNRIKLINSIFHGHEKTA